MAGGAGVEWYFGAHNAHNDLGMEDWRSRDRAWKWTSATIRFFQEHVPFSEMESHDELVPTGRLRGTFKAGGVNNQLSITLSRMYKRRPGTRFDVSDERPPGYAKAGRCVQ